MVKRSVGPRSKTRHKFMKEARERGMPPPSHTLRDYPAGTRVDVVVNPSVHGGMPHSRFHGLTGVIAGRQGACYVVDLLVGNKHKMIVSRPEHLRASGVTAPAAKA